MYSLWVRSKTDKQSEWFRMPYAERSYLECEQLLAFYEADWGSYYSYQVLPSTLEPKGRVAIR